ncbi:MAG: DJ-1/PfpI family protein [Clostridia bacterium]|nr:DJ-1/PfpI family protein [Clostridia bacterium]
MNEVLFFIFDGMTDYEITFAMHMLATEGHKTIITIAYEDRLVNGRSGAVYKPHRLVSDQKNIEAEGLIICGGWYGDYRDELDVLIQHLNRKQKLTAGICGAGTVMLAKSGVLKNIPYTTPIIAWGSEHAKVFGTGDPFPRVNYVMKPVVHSGSVITGLGHAFIEFTIEILDWFQLFSNAAEKDEFRQIMNG